MNYGLKTCHNKVVGLSLYFLFPGSDFDGVDANHLRIRNDNIRLLLQHSFHL